MKNFKKSSSRIIIFGTLLVCAVTFLPVLGSGFVNWDDPTLLLKNPLITSLTLDHLLKIFQTPVIKIYCPIVNLSYAVEYHFFKLNPFIYHLDNLILHLGIVFLIYQFCLRLGLSPVAAGLSALFFGIHPMHVESVAWVSERKDVLYAFFYMSALNFYLDYIENRRKALYLATLFCGLLSVLAKPMAYSLPFILLLCDWIKSRPIRYSAVAEKLPFFVLMAPILWMTFRAQAPYHHSVHIGAEALKVVWIFIFYIKKFLFPRSFAFFYPLPESVSILSAPYLTAIALLFLLIFLLVKFRHNRFFVFANLFYVLSIFLVLRRVQAHSPIGPPFYSIENRFMYLPSLGFCVFLGWGLNRLWQFYRDRTFTKGCIVVLSGLLLSSLAMTTTVQCHEWKNSMTLWNSVIAQNANSKQGRAIAYNNRGVIQSSLSLAMRDFNRCLELDPYFVEAYFNRAEIFMKWGDYPRAIEDYTHCIRMDPHDAASYYFRSYGHYKNGDIKAALADAEKAQALGLKVNAQ